MSEPIKRCLCGGDKCEVTVERDVAPHCDVAAVTCLTCGASIVAKIWYGFKGSDDDETLTKTAVAAWNNYLSQEAEND